MKKPRLGLVFGILHFVMWCAFGLYGMLWLNVHHQKFLATGLPFVFALWVGVTIVSWTLFNCLFNALSPKPAVKEDLTSDTEAREELDEYVRALLKSPEGQRAIERFKQQNADAIEREIFRK